MNRPNFYRTVHKGIRAMLFDIVVRAGRTDWDDTVAVATLRVDVQNAFAKLASHAEHENNAVAPLLEKAAVSVARLIGGAHDDQDVQLQRLLLLLDSVDGDARGHEFVVALSRFVGESLVHMADEEEQAMPALWRAFDDAQLLGAHQKIMAAIPPDAMESWMRWIVPSINRSERLMLMGQLTK